MGQFRKPIRMLEQDCLNAGYRPSCPPRMKCEMVGDVMVCEPAQCGQTYTVVTFIEETSPMQRILGTIISIMFWYLFFSLCCACCCPSEEEAQVVVIRNAGPAPASGVNQQQAQPPVQEHIIDMPIGLP